MFGDYGKIMEQFSGIQEKYQEMQGKIASLQATGDAGGGAVSVTLNGDGSIHKIDITPHLLREDQKEICEDLIIAAHKNAKSALDDLISRQQESIFDDLPMGAGAMLKNLFMK